jgi:uroporphyrinogen-III synthase
MPGLENKILAITRSERDAAEFIRLVSERGGRAIALPTIEIVPKGLEAANEFIFLLEKKKHDYCAFMSPQAVNILFDLAGREALLALRSTAVIAVGPKTKDALVERGVNVRLVPDRFSSEGLVDLLAATGPKGKKIIIPRSGAANELATQALTELGMQVDKVLLYTVRTSAPTLAWSEFSELLLQKKIDAVVFTSASNVSSFFELLGRMMSPGSPELDSLTKVVSIGPFTTIELKKREIECHEAHEHTIRGTFELAKKIV